MIRLSSSGTACLAIGLVTYAIGVSLGYLELAVVGGFLLAVLVGAGMFLLGGLKVDIARQVEPRRVERGRVALGALEITNTRRSNMAPMRVVDHISGQHVTIEVPRLHGGATHTSTYRLPTQSRGVVAVGPLKVERLSPLDLLARRSSLGSTATLIVHPRIHLAREPKGGMLAELDEGPVAEDALEGASSFQGLREYVIGDDLRKVHWPTSARTGRLMVRKYVDIEQPEALVLLDDSIDSYDDEDFGEEAVDIAASVLINAGTSARLALVSGRGGKGPVDALDLLTALDLHIPSPPISARSPAVPGTTIVVTGSRRLNDLGALAQFDCLRAPRRRIVVMVAADGPAQTYAVPPFAVLRARSAREVIALWNAPALV